MLSDRDERRTRPRPRGSNRARERAPRGGRRRRARHDGPFDLDGAQLTEIEARMAEADGGVNGLGRQVGTHGGRITQRPPECDWRPQNLIAFAPHRG